MKKVCDNCTMLSETRHCIKVVNAPCYIGNLSDWMACDRFTPNYTEANFYFSRSNCYEVLRLLENIKDELTFNRRIELDSKKHLSAYELGYNDCTIDAIQLIRNWMERFEPTKPTTALGNDW